MKRGRGERRRGEDGVNPVAAGIMVQVFGGGLLPNDHPLLVALTDGLTGFIRGKNGFEISIANKPDMSFQQLLALYEQTNSLESVLDIEISGY